MGCTARSLGRSAMNRRSLLLGATASLAAPAIAQTAWPHGQPIRVIVPFPAGAANDAMGRLAAQRLQEKFGAAVVVENRAAAKAAPNDWTFAIPALGAPSHLATVDFMSRTGLTIATSPYRGTAPALTDVMGGHVQLLIDASFALIPVARDGKVRTLGITTRERSPLAPDIPTIAEQGLAGYDFQSWYGLWAPKGTPREICARINALMRETMRDPPVVERLNKSLLEPVVETIDESRAFIAAEVPKHVALLKKAGFEAQ